MFCQFLKHTEWRGRFIAFFIVLMLASSPAPASAHPLRQDATLPQMILGQFVRAIANEGDVLTYRLPLEGGGNYLLFSDDSEQAVNFTVSVVGSERGEIINGQEFTDIELKLDPDEYVVTFTATADAELSAVVVGDFGQLSRDQDQPGALFNGSYLQVKRVRDTLYATLSLPETEDFQKLHIWLIGGTDDNRDDSYDIQVDNGDLYEFGSSSDEEEQGVQFWTRGGQFNVEIEPAAVGGSLRLFVLLSGPVPVIEKGTPNSFTVGGAKPNLTVAVDVQEAGSIVTAQVTPDSDSVNYQFGTSRNPQAEIETAYIYGTESKLSFMAPYAGRYILQLVNSNEPVQFDITVNETEQAPVLQLNHKIWGIVPAGEDALYRLQVDSAGDLLSLILVGNSDEIDLEATLINEEGEIIHTMSFFGGSSAAEMVSQADAQPGLYEVRVKNLYNDQDGKFVLSSRLEHPMDFAGQWASGAVASSEFDTERYNAMQATGEPNTLIAGDYPTAWASKEADGGEETLELSYEIAVVPGAIHIYESNAPGAIVKIEAFNAEEETWAILWQGNEPSNELSRTFSPELQSVEFATSQIRLTLDSATVSGWNEIDAVELFGLPK